MQSECLPRLRRRGRPIRREAAGLPRTVPDRLYLRGSVPAGYPALRGIRGSAAVCRRDSRIRYGELSSGFRSRTQEKLYNCAAVRRGGQILGLVPKTHLPNYAEFYEARQFTPRRTATRPMNLTGSTSPSNPAAVRLHGCARLPLCRGNLRGFRAPVPPPLRAASAGATVICNLSASNETVGKAEYRRSLVSGQSGRLVAAYLYANCGHGESTTDTVFSGHSPIAENGSVLAERAPFASGGALLYNRNRRTTAGV